MDTIAIYANLNYTTLLGLGGKVPISLEEFWVMNSKVLAIRRAAPCFFCCTVSNPNRIRDSEGHTSIFYMATSLWPLSSP